METAEAGGRAATGISRTGALLAALLFALNACSSTPQKREAKYLARGRKEFAAKEYRKAVIDFKVASQNMPKDAEPVYQLGMLYLTVGATQEAIESFTKAVSLNPRHEGAQYQMALVHLGSNKSQILRDAKQVLTAYTAKYPKDADALGALALAHARLGEKAEAIQTLEAAADRDPRNMRGAARVIALYLAQRDTDTAKGISRDLAARKPKSPDAAVLRAQVSLALHDTSDCDAQIRHALDLKRDFPQALQLRLLRDMMTQNGAGAEETSQAIAKLPQELMWGAYARMLFIERKFDQGIAEYNRALREHHDNARLRDEFSGSLIAVNRNAEAEKIATGTLQQNPRDRTARLQRATLEIDRGDIEDAAEDVKTLQALGMFSAQLAYEESRIFGARGETVKEGELLAEALKTNPRLLMARLELSRVLSTFGKPRVALETLDQALPSEKATAEYVFYRNSALMAAGNWTTARAGVDAALKVEHTPRFLCQDAMIRLHDNDTAGARKSLDASFQMTPADRTTINLLGEVMRLQNQTAQFTALLKEAAARNPKSAVLQDALGTQLEVTGDVDGARAAFEAERAAGEIAAAENQLALLEMKIGALDQARQRLLNLIKAHDNAKSHMMLAEIETQRGASPDTIVRQYSRVVDLQPSNVAAMNNLADVLAARQARYDDALFWAQKALGLSPDSPVIEDTVGWIYYRERKYDKALPFLEKSAKGLDRPAAHYHLAGALASIGEWTRARQEYQLALKENPQSEERASVAKLFERAAKN